MNERDEFLRDRMRPARPAAASGSSQTGSQSGVPHSAPSRASVAQMSVGAARMDGARKREKQPAAGAPGDAVAEMSVGAAGR
ncbi:hypothetical protein C3471_23430, partial [Mycobacterium kansasii]